MTLNVWTPKVDATAKLPVLVFIYGGGNVLGATNEVILSARLTTCRGAVQ